MDNYPFDMQNYLAQLLAEEALEIPEIPNDTVDNKMPTRKEMIEKLNSSLDIYNKPLFLSKKEIRMKYPCYNPNEYNECDTAYGKQCLSSTEYIEPFIETVIIRNGETISVTKEKIPETLKDRLKRELELLDDLSNM